MPGRSDVIQNKTLIKCFGTNKAMFAKTFGKLYVFLGYKRMNMIEYITNDITKMTELVSPYMHYNTLHGCRNLRYFFRNNHTSY